MNEPTPHRYVPRPADLEGATLRELVEGYRMHAGALVDARHGIGRREPVGRLRSTALDALARERWCNVADAVSYGATVADVAAAMGLDPVEVAAGLRSWAAGQHEHAGMSPGERDALYELVGGVEYATLAAAVAADDAPGCLPSPLLRGENRGGAR